MADDHILNILVRIKESGAKTFSDLNNLIDKNKRKIQELSNAHEQANKINEKSIQTYNELSAAQRRRLKIIDGEIASLKERNKVGTDHERQLAKEKAQILDTVEANRQYSKALRANQDELKKEIENKERAIKVANGEAQSLAKGTEAQKRRSRARAADSQAIATQISSMRESQRALKNDSNALNDHINALEKDRQTTLGRERASERFIRSINSQTTTLGRLRSALSDVNARAKDNSTLFGRMAHTSDEAERSSRRLEATLGRLGRSVRGLAIVGVLGFISALNSAIVGLVGHMIALGGAAVYAGGALGGIFVAGIAQAIPVLGIFAAAIARVAAVMNAVNEAQLVQKQGATQDASAKEAQKTAANQVADAQRGVRDAMRGVNDAERGLTEAHKAEQQAQQDLTEARADALEQVQDLMFAEKDEQLQLESSILSRKEAQEALQDAINSGASPLEIERLQLELKQANQDVIEQREASRRASEDADEARKKGVKSIDSYVSAQEALAEAHKGVGDAQRGVADASRQLADANRQLAQSHNDAATAAQDQSAAEQYLQFFIDQLTPAEKELYKSILRVKEFLKTQFTDVTDPIIKAFSTGINRGLDFIKQPAIFNGLKKLGADIGHSLNELTKFATNPAMTRFFEFIIGQASKNLPILTKGFEILARIFRNIAVAAAPILTKFLKFVNEQLREFNDLVSDRKSTEQFFETGFKFFKAWIEVLKGVLDLASALFDKSKSSAFESLTEFADTLHGAADDIREDGKAVKDFFDKSQDSAEQLGLIIVALARAMVEAFDPSTLEAVAHLIDDVLAPALSEAVFIMGKLINLIVFLVEQVPFIDFLLKWYVTIRLVTGSMKLLAIVLGGSMLTSMGKLVTLTARLSAAWKVLFGASALSNLKRFGAAFAVLTTGTTAASFFGGPPGTKTPKQTATASKTAAAGTAASAAATASTFSKVLAFTLTRVLPVALAALGLGQIIKDAIGGDFKDAGIKLGGAVIGGLIGFFASGGNPFGALLGAGIGAQLSSVLKNIFSQTDPVADAQNRLATATRAVAQAFRAENSALLALKQGHIQLRQAQIAHNQALLDEKIAHREYNRIVKEEGKNSEAARQALLNWKSAKQNTKQTTIDLTNAQKEENKEVNKAGKGQAELQDKINDEAEAIKSVRGELNGLIAKRQELRKTLRTSPKDSNEWDVAKEQIKGLNGKIEELKGSLDNTTEAYDHHLKKLANVSAEVVDFRNKNANAKKSVDAVGLGLSDFGKEADKTRGKVKDFGKEEDHTRKQTGKLKGTLDSAGRQARELGRLIGGVANGILKSFGVDKLSFNLPSPKNIVESAGSFLGSFAGQRGGFFAEGGFFGNPMQRGPDDRTIAVAGGEAILTGWHQKAANAAFGFANAMGASPYGSLGDMFNKDKREHKTAPAYAKGGKVEGFAKGGPTLDFALGPYTVPPITYAADHAGANSHVHVSAFDIPWLIGIGHKLQQMGNIVGEFAPTSAGNPFHFGPITTSAHAHYPTDHYSGHAIDVNSSSGAEPRSWVAAIAEVLKGGKAVGAAAAQLIKKINIKGPDGPIKDMLQGLADTGRKAANKYINKKSGSGTGTDIEVGPGALSRGEMRKLLKAHGLPDIAGWIAYAESGFNPKALNASSGASGLWQFLPSTWAGLGISGSPFDPNDAAEGFKKLYGQAGTQPWVASQSAGVGGGWGQHTGDPFNRGGIAALIENMIPNFDLGGIVPGMKGSPQLVMAHGGEVVLPTHKDSFQRGGYASGIVDYAKDEIGEIRDDIKDALKEGSGEKLKQFLASLEDIIRDGGLIDRLVEEIGVLTEALTNSLTKAIYKVHHGIVTKVLGDVKIANLQLNDLEKINDELHVALKTIDSEIHKIKRRLKGADKEQRDQLHAALEKLIEQQGEITAALAENLQARYDQQQAIFDAEMARLDSQLSIATTQQDIDAARAALHGKFGVVKQGDDLDEQRDILKKQRDVIEEQLKAAKKGGAADDVINALKEQLKENRLALIENTQAQKDLAQAKFEFDIEKLAQALQNITSRQEIAATRGQLAGTFNFGEQATAIGGARDILQEQRTRIQDELAKAVADGDDTRIKILQQALLDNTQALLDNTLSLRELKKQKFEFDIAALESKLQLFSTRGSIVQAQAQLSGTPLFGAQQAVLQGQAPILQQERTRIQTELAKAKASGDEQRVKELTQALLENKLAIIQNNQALKDLQIAKFQYKLDRLTDKIGRLDIRRQILDALANLSGRGLNVGAAKDIINTQRKLLEGQRDLLLKQLAKAQASGDTAQVNALQQQLLQNKLALIDNSQALKDLQLQVFQEKLEAIGDKISRLDIRGQIVDALANLSGNGLDYAAAKYILQQQHDLLLQQRSLLESQLAKAIAQGDTAQISDLQTQLLQNELALIQNTQSVKDLQIQQFTEKLEKVATKISDLDIGRQILDAISGLIGTNLDYNAARNIIDQQRTLLLQQRNLLQQQLAVAAGDEAQTVDLKTQLLQNQLSLIENTQALKDLQIQQFQDAIDKLSDAVSRLDIRSQILTALATLTGQDLNYSGAQSVLQQQATLLQQERALLQQQFGVASSAGDVTQINSLQTQLLQNELALIENSNDLKLLRYQIYEDTIAHIQNRISDLDVRGQILQVMGEISGNVDTPGQIVLLQQIANELNLERQQLLQELAVATGLNDTAKIDELNHALLENQLAQLNNTKAINELNGTMGKIFSFNSTAWQLWRRAIFNGIGGIMPQFPIPSLASGGEVLKGGLVNVHSGEIVVPAIVNPNTTSTPLNDKMENNFYFTEPMEVADPIALSAAIGMKLRTTIATRR